MHVRPVRPNPACQSHEAKLVRLNLAGQVRQVKPVRLNPRGQAWQAVHKGPPPPDLAHWIIPTTHALTQAPSCLWCCVQRAPAPAPEAETETVLQLQQQVRATCACKHVALRC